MLGTTGTGRRKENGNARGKKRRRGKRKETDRLFQGEAGAGTETEGSRLRGRNY